VPIYPINEKKVFKKRCSLYQIILLALTKLRLIKHILYFKLDKKACSAIHAVNLRNLLGAECRSIKWQTQVIMLIYILQWWSYWMSYRYQGSSNDHFIILEKCFVFHIIFDHFYKIWKYKQWWSIIPPISTKRRTTVLPFIPLSSLLVGSNNFPLVFGFGWKYLPTVQSDKCFILYLIYM
jgi:hypothetical protein